MRRPGLPLTGHWPCAVALGLLAAATASLLAAARHACEGRLVYPLDDTYIHMAVARSLARHGVWGLTRFGFTSCTSSLLWPLALAGAWLASGVRDGIPLLLNFLCGALLLAQVWRLHRRLGHPPVYSFLSLILVAVLTPLPPIIALGMEHTAHALLTVAFAAAAARVAAAEAPGRRENWPLWALAPLLAAVRYESLFVLAAACLLFICRRRWRLALGLGLWGAAPLVLFGLFAMSRGWYFFPNSVLLKAGLLGATNDVPALGGAAMLGALIDQKHLLTPFILTLAAVAMQVQGQGRQGGVGVDYDYEHEHEHEDRLKPGQRTKFIFPGGEAAAFGLIYILAFVPFYATLRQSLFGRYDAFMDAFGVAALMINLPGAVAAARLAPAAGDHPSSLVGSRWFMPGVLLLALPLLAPMAWRFAARSWNFTGMVVPASRNIYEQQYQMGRFARTFYAGSAVAVNDIGAVSYFGDVDCFDLYGLGSVEVARARREGRYDRETLERLTAARGVKMAMFYEHWLGEAVPAGWKKAGSWRITESCVCGGDTVSFYAAGPAELESLKTRLREFQNKLPARVIQDGDGMAAARAIP